MDLHHPAVESVVLPGLLALLLTGIARAVLGPGRRGLAACLGVGLAILAATVWIGGWSLQPASSVGRLPWLHAAALVAGLAVALTARRPVIGWAVTAVVALAGGFWAGGASGIVAGAAALLLAAVVARTPARRADGAALLAIAGAGLGVSVLAAGSLALFQQAILIAAATAGTALWLWPRPRLAFGPAAAVTVVLAWVDTALVATRTIPLAAPTIALLAIGIVVAALTSRSPLEAGQQEPPRRALLRPALAALVALTFAIAAVGWQQWGAASLSPDAQSPVRDDPYLQ